ncbi:hypothetical protein [Halobacteriaceae bacterium SHR40]|uniref:hypothetical protein n=1 Tax=Halovenus amylolytica TaxID=2500550 RepID=UPI000FE2D67E
MSVLEVFDSRGRALYPDDGSDDAAMRDYFDDHVFAMATTDEGAVIEMYLRVKTENQREQVSLRFQGTNADTILADCRNAVQRLLVDQRGWEIMEPYGTGPEEVFWHAIWQSNQTTATDQSLPKFFRNERHGLGLDPLSVDILQQFPLEDNSPPARILASDYENIANALVLFQGSEYTVSVSRARRIPPEHAQIHFSLSQNQVSNFELHSDTTGFIEQRKSQHREEKRKEKLQSLQATIGELNELGANQSQLKDSLSGALGSTYPDLKLLTAGKLNELRKQARSTSRLEPSKSLKAGHTGPSPLRGLFSVKKGALLLIPIIVIICIGMILMFTSIGIPLIDNNGSTDAASSEFTIELTEATEQLERGQSFNASIEISNTGTVSDSQPIVLSVTENTTDETTVNLGPGENQSVDLSTSVAALSENEYEYSIESNDDSIEGTFNITN